MQNYVRTFGCSLNDLSVQQGPRWRPQVASECVELKAEAGKSSRPTWMWYEPGADVLKSAATLSSGELLKRLGDCSKASPAKPISHMDAVGTGPLVAKLMAKPLFIDKARFDVRAYMLVASTMPFTVFFRRGYVRVAKDKSPVARHGLFDSKDASDMSMDNFQRHLANGKITGTHFVDTFLKSSMKRIALLVFQAARPSLRRRRGSYQLYALDFVVDDQMRVYLDKSQPYPAIEKSSAYDASSMVADVHDLVMELAEEPTAFNTMIVGDKYGPFELIFSELRETCEGTIYNPCHAFADFNAMPLAKANRKISAAHNAANREHHEETRIKKKLEEEKKAVCKTNKLSAEGKACDKLDQELQRKEFEKLFAEHEKEWNVNQFRMPKPGEVFPWEVV